MENSFPAEPHHTDPNEPHKVTEPQPSEIQGAASSEAVLPPSTDAVSDTTLPRDPEARHEGREVSEVRSDTENAPTKGHEQNLQTGGSDHEHEQDSSSANSEEDIHSASDQALEPVNYELGSLEDFAERARRGRLNSEEESEAVAVLKEALLGGRVDVAKAVAATPSLPWIVSVQATAAAWPEMKPSFRSQFLAGLARAQGEQAARIRLSLARGLFKVDQSAALKLILLSLKLLRNKETGLLEGKGPALFANVLIGRGKAWALQLPLQTLKPIEADLLVFAALHGAFHAPQAPIAQLSILKWAAAAERLTRLPEALETLILKGISRWSGKWQAALRKEVSPLPDSWTEGFKNHASKQADSRQKSTAEKPEQSGEQDSEDQDQPNQTESSLPSAEDRAKERPTNSESDDDDEDEDDNDDEQDEAETPSKHKQRPVYVSKTVPHHGAPQQPTHTNRRGSVQSAFNLQDTLRQIDNYVAGLRGELASTQKQLRQREDDPRRARRNERPAPVVVPGELSTEELMRLNQQLESRNAELKARIDELTLDSEERAASSGLISNSVPPDASTQLRTLLGFKLKDDYEDYLALQQEARDLVVQQHYRTLLQHVFEVLLAEGIHFPEAGPEPVN